MFNGGTETDARPGPWRVGRFRPDVDAAEAFALIVHVEARRIESFAGLQVVRLLAGARRGDHRSHR